MSAPRENERTEFFSDGVFAIAITLLVLELKVPATESITSTTDLWLALNRLWPTMFAVVLSFFIILIGWLAHHGLLKLLDKSSLYFMFANGFYLLTIMLFPFASALVAEYYGTPFAAPAVMVYGCFNLLQSIGMALLVYSAQKPKLLAKDANTAAQLKNRRLGPALTIPTLTLLIILAYWFPHTSFYLILLMWIGLVYRIFYHNKKMQTP
jgi:uncharacterized membrane protein